MPSSFKCKVWHAMGTVSMSGVYLWRTKYDKNMLLYRDHRGIMRHIGTHVEAMRLHVKWGRQVGGGVLPVLLLALEHSKSKAADPLPKFASKNRKIRTCRHNWHNWRSKQEWGCCFTQCQRKLSIVVPALSWSRRASAPRESGSRAKMISISTSDFKMCHFNNLSRFVKYKPYENSTTNLNNSQLFDTTSDRNCSGSFGRSGGPL
jgi:hypothetical protein